MAYQGPYTKNRSKRLLLFRWKQSPLFNGNIPFRDSSIVSLTRTRTGYSNRAYRDQIRKVQNATTSMTGEFQTMELRKGSAMILWRTPLNTGSQTIATERAWGDLGLQEVSWTSLTPSDSPNARAYERATADAYKKIREAQTLVSGPTFLGEARETLRMLKNPAKGLRDIANDWVAFLKKRKKAQPKKWTKDLSSAWLEHSFGWTPFLADAKDAMSAWNRLFDLERVMPFQGFGVETTDRGTVFSRNGVGTGGYININHTRQDLSTRIVKYRGVVKATAKTGPRAQLELFGFTPSEFLPTAYELLPWSFLFDYFANLGDIISAGVTDTSNVAWVNRSEVAIYDINLTSIINIDVARAALGTDDYVFAEGQPARILWQRRRVSRGANFPLSPPNLVFEIPGSNKQLANIAALLGQCRALHPQKYR